jgi:hypothetical protein
VTELQELRRRRERRDARHLLRRPRRGAARRRASRCPQGVSWVRVSGVTVALDDPSLVASIQGDRARVIAARVVRRVREEPAASAAEVDALEADHRAAEHRRAEADASLQRVEAPRSAAGREASRPRGSTPSSASPRRRDEDAARAGAGVGRSTAAPPRPRRAPRVSGPSTTRASTSSRADAPPREGRRVHPRYEAVVEVQVEAREAHACEVDPRVPNALRPLAPGAPLSPRDAATTAPTSSRSARGRPRGRPPGRTGRRCRAASPPRGPRSRRRRRWSPTTCSARGARPTPSAAW